METAVISFIILGLMSGSSHGVGVLPDSLDAPVGGNVNFTTTLTPPQLPFVVVAWSFTNIHGTVHDIITSTTGDIINPEYKSRITLFRSTGSLELRSLSLNDNGEYSVSIIPQGAGQLNGKCKLVVHVPVSNVVVTPSSTDLMEFSSVTLSCSSSGASSSFLWLNGSSEVTASDRVQIAGSILTVINVTRYDQGPFRCRASNVVSNVTSEPVKLSINFGPENITLEASPLQEYYDEGSDISLFCSAVSSPPALFQWFLNKTLLSDTGPEFRLENIKMNQSGEYSCKAYNNKTMRYQTSLPSVVTVLQAIISNVVVTPSSTDLLEFSSVTLSCSSSGSFPSFLWLNDSSEVTANDKVQITNGGSTLTIINVTRYDQGPFRCRVSNPFSNDTSDPVDLSINFGPENINLTVSASQEYYDQGSNINLSCSAVSRPPAMFHWVLNGALLSDTGPALRLNNIQMSQSGNYSCLAFNSKTMRNQISQPAVINVLATVSDVVVTPSSTDLIEFSSVTLSCSSSGVSPSYLWLNGTSEITASKRVQITDGGSTLTILNVTRYDQGPYKCNMSNPVSSGISLPVNLVIQYGPESVAIIGPNSIHAGDFIMLYCSATSVPSATITWKFKGTNTQGEVYIANSSTISNNGTYACTAVNSVTGHSETAHHELSVTVTDLPAGDDCSLYAVRAMFVTAGCCLVIAAVCAIIVNCLIRRKGVTKSKYSAHHSANQTLETYKITGPAQFSSISLEPDHAFMSTAL
ncbi:hypothetical protein LDENG_00000670 [Lucifuga dentata]|nr:hypothetical protein LDENG_00000670 [Lucifuga dentata]